MKLFTIIHSAIFTLLMLCCACTPPLDDCQEALLEQERTFNTIALDCSTSPVVGVASFTGLINGQRVCYYDGEQGYAAKTNHWVRSVTDGPVLNPNVPPRSAKRYITFGIMALRNRHDSDYHESIVISTPLCSVDSSWSAIARQYLKPGPLQLQNEKIGEHEGFNVLMEVPVFIDPTTNTFGAEVIGGKQDNSRLEIVELEYYEEFGWEYYRIVLEVECNLYMRTCRFNVPGRQAFRLTQGRLEMTVSVPQ